MTVIAMVSVALSGAVGVILMFASAATLALLAWRSSLVSLRRYSILLALPVFAILSTYWSDAPQLTMRSSLQLLITFVISILVAVNLPPRGLLVALFLGTLALCASSLPHVPVALSTGVPLTSSLLGSKNQLGFWACLAFAVSTAISVDKHQHWAIRLTAIFAVPLALLFASLSKSGGATVSILLTVLLFPPLAVLAAMKPRTRIVFSAIAMLIFANAFIFQAAIDQRIASFRTEVLNKNESLTGRTYLWDVAERLSRERPVLGYGYDSFWRHGNLEAEALWRWGGISERSGFNFHNMVMETRIGLGLVGVAVLLLTCAGIAGLALLRQLKRPTVPMAFMLSTTLVLFVRSSVENGLIAPFSVLTMILLATGVYAAQPLAPEHVERDGRTLNPGRRQRLRRGSSSGPQVRRRPSGARSRVS